MLPLVQTVSPARLVNHPINRFGDWYQWSEQFREVLIRLAALIPEIPRPEIVNLHKGRAYDHTYTIKQKLIDASVHEELLQSARSLYRMRVTNRLLLLREMIGEEISGATLHYLFSYYQFCFGCLTGQPDAAMYAPLGDLSESGFPFPLHADLYVQQHLMIVFDNIPADGSGQTLLLPTENFLKILDSLKTMPEEAKERLRRLLTERHSEDHFNDFFPLLYQKEAPWLTELNEALEAQRLMLKFLSGEGFILHDRLWLHGRTAPSGGVYQDRLHRLIFNCAEAA